MVHFAEINEREVEVDFTNRFGDIVINCITDIETGDYVCDDLLDERVEVRLKEDILLAIK